MRVPRYNKKCYLHLLLPFSIFFQKQYLPIVAICFILECEIDILSSVLQDMGAVRMLAADKHELAEAVGRARFPNCKAYCLVFGTNIFMA